MPVEAPLHIPDPGAQYAPSSIDYTFLERMKPSANSSWSGLGVLQAAAGSSQLINPVTDDLQPATRESNMSDPTREEIAALIGASEARTDTKIARLEGKLDLVLSKLENVGEKITSSEANRREDSLIFEANRRDDGRAIRANQWVIGLGLAVLIVAVVALFPVFFSVGTQLKDMVDRAVETAVTGPRK